MDRLKKDIKFPEENNKKKVKVKYFKEWSEVFSVIVFREEPIPFRMRWLEVKEVTLLKVIFDADAETSTEIIRNQVTVVF